MDENVFRLEKSKKVCYDKHVRNSYIVLFGGWEKDCLFNELKLIEGVGTMCLYFGYEVHKRPKFLTKDTVLFSNENETHS